MVAELGACSPYIIAPGEWTEAELDHSAKLLVHLKTFNSSAVCASPQLLLMQKEWPQREAFLTKIEEAFKAGTTNGDYLPFYPGTEKRCELFKEQYPAEKVKEIDLGAKSYKPVLLHLAESDLGSYACKQEAFAPVLCGDPRGFHKEAARQSCSLVSRSY